MGEDIVIGLILFFILWLAAVVGRKVGFPHSDIWSSEHARY